MRHRHSTLDNLPSSTETSSPALATTRVVLYDLLHHHHWLSRLHKTGKKISSYHNMDNIHEFELREQDRWLPIANVARLMKNTLPTTAKVSKDAKECMQECVLEFISFITLEALDKCLREKRKTINGEDILYLMHDLGFENYAEVLKIYLAKYREQQALRQERGETRTLKRAQKQAQAAAAAAAVALISEEQLVLQLPALEPFDQLAPFETEQLLGALPEPFFYGDAAPAPDDPKYRLDDFIRDDRPMDERPHDDELLAAAISTDNPSFF